MDINFYEDNNKKWKDIKIETWSNKKFEESNYSIKKFEKFDASNFNLQFGDVFLFQEINYDIDGNGYMTYPTIATFSHYDIWDQALVYCFMMKIRTKYYYTKNKYKSLKFQLEEIPVWDNKLYIYKVWKYQPSWKEMKPYFYKTLYFKLNRKDKINIIKKIINV